MAKEFVNQFDYPIPSAVDHKRGSVAKLYLGRFASKGLFILDEEGRIVYDGTTGNPGQAAQWLNAGSGH